MRGRAFTAALMAGFAAFLALIALAAGTGASLAADADVIEGGAARNHFYIEPSYDGTSIALFGAVDTSRLKDLPFDVAVTVRGPVKPVTVWKKGRRAGVWVNTESLTFEGVPNYYAVLTTKPVDAIAPLEERVAHEIGLDALNLPLKEREETPARVAPSEFKQALIKLKRASGLFVEESQGAIDFFGKRLFRARTFLPPAATPGLYRAEFFILQNGKVIGEASAHIRLRKIGIEARLSSTALDYPWFYGVLAVMLAAAVGGGASLVFRKT
jgi:uncharacterized protein (TIGR02186 family)